MSVHTDCLCGHKLSDHYIDDTFRDGTEAIIMPNGKLGHKPLANNHCLKCNKLATRAQIPCRGYMPPRFAKDGIKWGDYPVSVVSMLYTLARRNGY